MTGSAACEEFSRVVDAGDLDDGGVRLEVIAGDDERRALADRLGILEVGRLEATAHLTPAGADRSVRLRATFRAEVVQACVLTLEPVRSLVEEDLDLTYSPPTASANGDSPLFGEVEVGLDEDDPPEPLVAGVIDVGAAIAEHLALALDPYPRRPGARLDTVATDNGAATDRDDGPFSALRQLTEPAEGNT